MKHVVIRVMAAVVWGLCFFALTAQAKYGGGSGEPNNPYRIYTAEQMNEIGTNPADWDKCFKLMSDIDMSGFTGTQYNIIGDRYYNSVTNEWTGTPFTGFFDGDGHTISNFTYSCTEPGNIGLFGYLGDPNAQIKDLGLINPYLEAGTRSPVGSLAGRLESGTLFNCFVNGGTVSGEREVGGMVGYLGVGTVSSCHVQITVRGDYEVGGLVGFLREDGTITRSCSDDSTVEGVSGIGGLVGGNQQSVIRECYSSGTVSGARCVGGLAGGNNNATILNCYSSCSILASDKIVGGLVGSNTGEIIMCYSSGAVTGTTNTGGLVGSSIGTVTVSYWDVESSGQLRSAGARGKTTVEMKAEDTFMGWGCSMVWTIDDGFDYPHLAWENKPGNLIDTQLSDILAGTGTDDNPYLVCTNYEFNRIGLFTCDWDKCFRLMTDVNMSGQIHNTIGTSSIPFSGGFDGNGHSISNFTYTYDDTDNVGLFGSASDPDMVIENLRIKNPYISANGPYCTGGVLVGRLLGGTIRNCQVQGCSISGMGYRMGGLVGTTNGVSQSGVKILNCSVTGSATGYSQIGLLVGENDDNSNIYGCYTEGTVSGRVGIGGLAGLNYGHVEKNYSSCAVKAQSNYSGGLIGGNSGILEKCYSSGRVSGDNRVGGLVGRTGGEVYDCFTIAFVEGREKVGGLAGYNDRGIVTNSYSAGPVSGTTSTGGLIGENYNGAIFDSFWDVNSSGQQISSGGTGRTTDEMMKQATFINWDFINIWDIYENATYPFIKDLPLPSYQASNPEPPNGAAIVHVDAKLCWTSGFSAISHDVYFGNTNPPPFVGNQTQNTFKNDQMDYETTYFWRIDEISNTGTTEGNVWSFTTGPSYGGGTGRPDDPYLIYTSEQLNLIGLYTLDWDKHFKLMANINLSNLKGSEFNHIGTNTQGFNGVFDGNKHRISNLNWVDPEMFSVGVVGIFRYVGSAGVIRDLTLENINIKAPDLGGIGALVGVNSGEISACGVYDANILGGHMTGGLVGKNDGGVLSECCSKVNVVSRRQDIGGLVGANKGSIINSYSEGSVTSTDDYVGGLVGDNERGTIVNCYSNARVSGDFDVGGLSGHSWGSAVKNSFWDIETSGQTSSAGGTGKTTAEMQMASTFIDAGWDFNTPVWTIVEGVDYPRLWWEFVPLLTAEVRIIPRTINLESKGNWITCYIRLPDGFNVADIDPNSVFLESKIQAEIFYIDEKQQVATARFSREELRDIINTGEVELTITGRLTNGNVFEGKDIMRVLHKGGGKLAKCGKADNPNPAERAGNVSIYADLSWTAGYGATSHDVYFGTRYPPPFICNQTATTFDPGTLTYATEYYWRIDEVNQWGKTTGEVWSFTTPPPPPPPPSTPSPP